MLLLQLLSPSNSDNRCWGLGLGGPVTAIMVAVLRWHSDLRLEWPRGVMPNSPLRP